MATLTEEILNKCPRRLRPEFHPDHGHFMRSELHRPDVITCKVKNFGKGRTEFVVRRTNLQRVLDLAQSRNRPRGRRVFRRGDEARQADNVSRSKDRSRATVRALCIRMHADHLVTFTTRCVIPFDQLLVRFQRFQRSYKEALKRAKCETPFLYCAVPELHSDGVHWHIHLATHGYFDLAIGNPIWWSLCRSDDVGHDRNGNIDVKRFSVRQDRDDIPSIVAGYITKYLAKTFEVDFNRRRYWSSRVKAADVDQVILDADTWVDAQTELTRRFGISWTSILLVNNGAIFVFPDEKGFWFKCTDSTPRLGIPF